jgi:hypothetical protein
MAINYQSYIILNRKKLFKHLFHKHYDAWLNKDNHILIPSGKIKRALGTITVEWISKVLKDVPVNITPESFIKCLLSNVEDGMQDGILQDISEQSGEEASSSSENESVTEGSLDELSD